MNVSLSLNGSQAVYGYHDIHPYHKADSHEGYYTIYTEER